MAANAHDHHTLFKLMHNIITPCSSRYTISSHLVQADALELKAVVGRGRPNSPDMEQAVGAVPGLLAAAGKAGVILAHSAILCC